MLTLYTEGPIVTPQLESLRAKYPWPKKPPAFVAEDWHGWLHSDTAKALTNRLSEAAQLVVECGTWLGFSAKAILEAAPNSFLVCIDTWRGSPEHQNDRKPDGTDGDWRRRLRTLYETCQRNLWQDRHRVILVRQDSLVGLGEVFAAGLAPDLIYLDTKHTLGRVTAELALCLELFPDSPVVGDDFNNAAVELAAREHARITNRPLVECGVTFAFEPWKQV